MKQGRMMKANAVRLTKLEIDLVDPPSGRATAQAALVSTVNGVTYGWLKHQMFSAETHQKMAELIASVEEDLASFVFEDAETGGGATAPPTTGSGGGLSEHLSRRATDAEPA